MNTPTTPSRRHGGTTGNAVTATARTRQKNVARMLGRNNELLHASRAFAAWAAFTRERKLKVHMKRCATLLKRHAVRQDYSRYFFRWLAFTQSHTSDFARSAIQLRQDVPLRSKADFLYLAQRYFTKWRTHLRETKQRTRSNVDALAALNRERLRTRALMRWLRFYHAQMLRRHEAEIGEREAAIQALEGEVRQAVNEAEDLRDQLIAALQKQADLQDALDARREDVNDSQQQRQLEIQELRESMWTAMELVEGHTGPHVNALRKRNANSSPPLGTHDNNPPRGADNATTTREVSHARARGRSASMEAASLTVAPLSQTAPLKETASNSARQSKDTQTALLQSIQEAARALTQLLRSPAGLMSMKESIEALRQQLQLDEEDMATLQAQRDELAAAARAARLSFASVNPHLNNGGGVGSPTESEYAGGGRASREASVNSTSRIGGPGNISGLRSNASVGHVERSGLSVSMQSNGNNHSNTRRYGAATAIVNSSLPVVYLPSGTSPPPTNLSASPPDGGSLTHYQDLSRLLVEDARTIVNTLQSTQNVEKQTKREVVNLQDAALRAIDALGGSGVSNEAFMAQPHEAAEAREQRSSAIADSLRNLCEDMIIVLVLTSLWSGKRASERVSEALERLWYRTQDLESTHAGYLKQLDDYTKVVAVATGLLRPRPAPTSNAGTSPASSSAPRAGSERRSSATAETGGGAPPVLARRRRSATPENLNPPTEEEVVDARTCAEALVITQGDARPSELLNMCEKLFTRAAAQSSSLEGELQALLHAARNLLQSTVGAQAVSPTHMPTNVRRPRSKSALNNSSNAINAALANETPTASDMVAALAAGADAVSAVLHQTRPDDAKQPLLQAWQELYAGLQEAQKETEKREKALQDMAGQLAQAQASREKDAKKHMEKEEQLKQQLIDLGEQVQQGNETCKQLEGQLREAESQAKSAERAKEKQLDELAKKHRAAEKEWQQQRKTLQRDVEQQAQDRRHLETEMTAVQDQNNEAAETIQRLQEALEKDRAAHARAQSELDGRLHAAMSESETSAAALASVENQLAAAKKECAQREDEVQRLEEDLQQEQDAHAQTLQDFEAQHKTAEAVRQAHRDEIDDVEKRLGLLLDENQKFKDEVAVLQDQLRHTEKEGTLTAASEKELQQQLEVLETEKKAQEVKQKQLESQLVTAVAERGHLTEQLVTVAAENRVNNAVGIFVRDVLRDCLTRLYFLTRDVGEAASYSPSASLTLRQAADKPPPLLTHDSDPSEYVEYILRLDGNDPTGKRLVQEHLRENAAVHGLTTTFGEEVGVEEGNPEDEPAEGEKAATRVPAGVVAAPVNPSSAASLSVSSSAMEHDGPSTWEVVAELHDRLVMLYERIAQLDEATGDQRVLHDALSKEKEQLCADALVTLQRLQPWSSAASAAVGSTEAAAAVMADDGPSPSSSMPTLPSVVPCAEDSPNPPQHLDLHIRPDVAGPALRHSSADVTSALEALQQVVDSMRPLVKAQAAPDSAAAESGDGLEATIATTGARSSSPADLNTTKGPSNEHLHALVVDIQDMASCLQQMSESMQHGIRDLGGVTGTGGDRLETICKETGTSIRGLKQLLGSLEDGNLSESSTASTPASSPLKPPKLRDVLPLLHTKMVELKAAKKESARILAGLNRAFDDDEESLLTTISSMQSRSLKPKKKPLPAFQGTPETGLRLLQQEMKGKKFHRTATASNGSSPVPSINATIRDRLGDLQNLRLVCRNTLQVLEGSVGHSGGDGQPPTYGEALVALLTTQVEDLKQVLPETDEALKGYRSNLRNVSIGTRLHLLADVVQSLKAERDSLKEDLNLRGRQSNMLMEDLSREAKALRAEIASRKEAGLQLSKDSLSVSQELEAQKRNAAELAARLAQLQHESNVLTGSLARVLHSLPATAYCGKSDHVIEKTVQAAVRANEGEPLTTAIEAALAATQQHQQQLRDTLHTAYADLREQLSQLRMEVSEMWPAYGATMAQAAAQLVTDTAEVLTLENDMLRPRAIERESLKREVAQLETLLTDARAECTGSVSRLEELVSENAQLRRAVRDAEMASALANVDQGASASPAEKADPCAVEWERRMIEGATDLTMDAIDSMSGHSMSTVFGAVAEETLRIYRGVREALRAMEGVYENNDSSGNNGNHRSSRSFDGYRLRARIDEQLEALRKLSASAEYLWSRLPLLYQVAYD